jgi:predicted membrane-bound dolichyl-phosphate-mannose-protein mannosyltransferase
MVQHNKPPLSGTLKTKLVQFARRLSNPRLYIYAFIIPLLIIFIFDIPFMARFGSGWLANFPGNIHWFLTSKTGGGSAPWGWFVNENLFPLYVPIIPIIYFTALIALIFVPYLARRVDRNYLVPGLWFSMTFLGFVLMYVLGNTTQYSYYIVALSPMVYVLACVLVYYLIENVLTYIRFMVPVLRNPKPFLIKIRRNPKSIIRKFLKIYKSSDPFMIRPHRAPKKRKPKKKRKLRSIK